MDFFLHSSKAFHSKKLLKLQQDYGLGGIGFYWQAVELIISHNYRVPISFFMVVRYSPIREDDVEPIIRNYGLFDVDENNMVTLYSDKENGIGEESINLLKKLTLACGYAEAGAEARAEAGAEARVEAGAEARTHPGPCEIDINKITLKKTRARDKFDRFMQFRCPHLLEMEEPLTLEDFYELKLDYTWIQIQEVLLAMENEIGLSSKRRSCYLTALSWLKQRFGLPQGGLRQKGIVKVRDLDEYGNPIYNQLNNNNGKQDSNSAVCAADAEQQGDGGGCAERPDE